MVRLLVSLTNTPQRLTTVEFCLDIRVRVRMRVVTLCVQSLKNTTIWESINVDFPSGQATVHSHLPDGQRLRQIICQLNKRRPNYDLLSKGQTEMQDFSSPAHIVWYQTLLIYRKINDFE